MDGAAELMEGVKLRFGKGEKEAEEAEENDTGGGGRWDGIGRIGCV